MGNSSTNFSWDCSPPLMQAADSATSKNATSLTATLPSFIIYILSQSLFVCVLFLDYTHIVPFLKICFWPYRCQHDIHCHTVRELSGRFPWNICRTSCTGTMSVHGIRMIYLCVIGVCYVVAYPTNMMQTGDSSDRFSKKRETYHTINHLLSLTLNLGMDMLNHEHGFWALYC